MEWCDSPRKKDKDKDKKKGDKKKINEDSVAANKKSAAADACWHRPYLPQSRGTYGDQKQGNL